MNEQTTKLLVAARRWAGQLRWIDLDQPASPIADILEQLCNEVESLQRLCLVMDQEEHKL